MTEVRGHVGRNSCRGYINSMNTRS